MSKRTSSESVNYNDSDSSEDDVPIAQLQQKRLKERKEKMEASKPTKSSSSSSSSSSSKSTAVKTKSESSSSSSAVTKREYIIQKLLVRWWYAITWPDPKDYANPPPGYESLDGFPGVFVSTAPESLGTLLDMRNKETCPCYKNFKKLPAQELVETCIRAYEKQISVLEELEPDNTNLILTLKNEKSDLQKIKNYSSIDRNA